MIWPKGQDKNFIKLAWAVFSIGVALVSYFFYGPLNPKFFNSDQAIHVLMTCDFNWPADAYYWGQNRLGSFLPLLASPIYQATNIHPIYLLGLLNFLCLLMAYYFLQKHIESNWGKVFFLLALFFPHPTYYYLLLIGHPYGAQILCLTLSVHTYILFKRKLENDFSKTSSLVYLYLYLFFVFSTLSVWINELSLLLFLGIFLSLLRSKLNGKYFFAEVLKNWRHYKYLWFTSIFLVYLGYSFIHYLKVNAFQDAEYSKTFIFSKEDILKQLDYVVEQIKDIVLIQKHHSSFQGIFYYSLVLVFIIILLKIRKIDVLLITLIISSLLLFFSYWNFRSHFDAKYYIPIYLGLLFWMAYYFKSFGNRLSFILFSIIILPLFLANYDYISITRESKNTLELFKETENIPAGVVYGNYWDVYRLSGASAGRITGMSMNNGDFRNKHKWNKIKENNNWYVYSKNIAGDSNHNNDTIIINEEIKLVRTKNSYIILGDTLFQYQNIAAVNFQ